MARFIIMAFLRTIFLFGLLSWGYVVAMQVVHPESVFWGLAWWLPIRMDYFGEIGFISAAVAYLLVNLIVARRMSKKFSDQ